MTSRTRSADRSIVVLMTATVRPNPALPEGTPIDVDRRKRSYEENVRYWLAQPWVRGVVFAENSMTDLGFLHATARETAGDRLEVLSVGGNDFPGAFGKGFGEAELLDRTFGASALLRQSVLAVKVTGLQVVTNLWKLISRLPEQVELAVDLREHDVLARLGIGRAARRCDTRCFLATPTAYRSWLSGVHRAHAGREFFLEDAYFERTRNLAGAGIRLRFPIEPAFRGSAGHWGKDYGSPGQRVKHHARAFLRWALPGLWI